MKLNKLASILSISATALLLGTPMAQAVPFTITSTLTGDPRPDNPDNLFVNVTITGDTISADTFWKVDLASPAHTNMKLDAFFFNLDGAAGDYSFNITSPSDWIVSTSTKNAEGSGNAKFMFEVDKDKGKVTDVTNLVNLTFTATKPPNWLVTDFILAPTVSLANNSNLASGQLGAHLQSLSVAEHLQSLSIAENCGTSTNCSDSGFAMGNYVETQGPREIPEPMSLLLIGAGLFGFAAVRRCRLV